MRTYSSSIPDLNSTVYGSDVRSGSGVSVDCSNTAEGYVIVKYSGSSTGKIKAQVIKGDVTYTYDLSAGSNEILPFTQGNGSYTVRVLEGVGGTSYALAFSVDVSVSLRNSLLPFLYPNQYVNFNGSSSAAGKAAELANGCANDLEVMSAIFKFVTSTLSYDHDLAKTVKSGYIPNIDSVLSRKKGICFDYSALMCAMLRSERIPSKLIIGYAGEAYHAWIDVYLDGKGWITAAISYDGNGWKMMDPTYVSSSGSTKSLSSQSISYSAKYQY